jgi:hypothetical protein
MSSLSSYSCNPWISRISSANKAFDAWASKFNCKRLEDYYENFQWKARTDGPQLNYKPYTLNLVYSTIEIKLDTFLFQKPSFIVSPEPGHSHWDLDFAVESAQLKQDVLNTIVKNKNVKFARSLKYAALDSFFYFSLIEVGYAADWRNPLKEEPYLNTWDNPDIGDDKIKVKSQNEVAVNERMYVKRIKPERFRVSVSDAEELEDHEWVGYYHYYYSDTLKKTKGIKFPDDYSGTTFSSNDIGSFSQDTQSGLFLSNRSSNPVCKVWHIWDMVAHKRRLILDGYDDTNYELWNTDFENLPLIDHRWVLRRSGFYPIPLVWYWLSSQDEINEAREQIRSYRRRFTRKFQMVKGGVSEEEAEKFVSGPDGILVEVKQADAIKAIDNPEIGPTSENALIQAKDDFNLISGTSAEARGQNADRETATAAKLVDQRSQIRESSEQLDFTVFVASIGREILVQASEKLSDGLWVKYSSNPSEGVLQDMQINAPYFKYIKAQDLSDGYDFDVAVDVINATPAAMQAEQTSYVNFVAFLTQYPMVAMSPTLIRETAYRFGYKNEQVIHQIQQVAVLSMAAKASQAGASGQQIQQAANGNANGGGGSNAATTSAAQMATPDSSQISQQLTKQIQ